MSTPNKATPQQIALIVAMLADGSIDRSHAQAITRRETASPAIGSFWLRVFGDVVNHLIESDNQAALVEAYSGIRLADEIEEMFGDADFEENFLCLVKSITLPWVLADIASGSKWDIAARKVAIDRIEDQAVLARLLAYLVIGPNSNTKAQREDYNYAADPCREALVRHLLPRLTRETLETEWGIHRIESFFHICELVLSLEYLLKLVLTPIIEPENSCYRGTCATWSEDHYIWSAWDELKHRRHAHRWTEIHVILADVVRKRLPGFNLEAAIQSIDDRGLLHGLLESLGEDHLHGRVSDEVTADLRGKIEEQIGELERRAEDGQ